MALPQPPHYTAELARLVAVWPSLPETVRAAVRILAGLDIPVASPSPVTTVASSTPAPEDTSHD